MSAKLRQLLSVGKNQFSIYVGVNEDDKQSMTNTGNKENQRDMCEK